METQESYDQAICRLVALALQVPEEQVSAQLAFGEIPQWTSLGHMEIMFQLESELGVEISEETITQLISIPAMVAYLQENGVQH
ncbi:MAG: acyl carrier protein [Anaerolineales bacterium]|nr:acyl carrier protein [Anaerolineales bacterium]